MRNRDPKTADLNFWLILAMIILAVALVIASVYGANAGERPGGWHQGGGPGWQGRHSRYHVHRPHYDPTVAGAAVVGGAIGSWIYNRWNPPPPPIVVAAPLPPPPPVVVVQPQPVVVALVPWSPEWYQYCSVKYRSFNAQTGTYRSYSGETRFCQ